MRYVILDRDGTLIRHVPYLHEVRHVELLPTVTQGLAELVEAGCRLFLHTNQSGIGRGYFSAEEAVACNEAMLHQIGRGSALFAEVCVSPEIPGQDVGYRKPSPRWAQELMARHGIAASNLCYVGDNVSDLLTARNVGCAGVGVGTGVPKLRERLAQQGLQYPVFDSFLDAARHIVGEMSRA